MHYNEIFVNAFRNAGFDVVYQPSCLINDYNQHCWPIKFPEVNWTDNTVVVMHTQDFVSINNGKCPELELIENHFGERSNRVVVIHWNIDLHTVYNGPLHLMYFPTHSYELLNKLSKTQEDWNVSLFRKRTKNWQCLNGTTRKHRELIAYYMQEHFTNGILSFGERIPLPEWDFSTYYGCENELNWIRLLPVYADCKVNIVTETQYYESPGIITEKTLMALLGLQVPIVIGYPGIAEHCKRLGFDMFEDLVDHSYDNMPDDARWKAAIDLNKGLINGKFDRNLILDRLLWNQNYVLNKWPNLLVEQFNDNARDIVEYLRRLS
jgi:hypothetical protein